MSVEIKPVLTRSELRKFVNFPEKLYRHNPYYVPPLVRLYLMLLMMLLLLIGVAVGVCQRLPNFKH